MDWDENPDQTQAAPARPAIDPTARAGSFAGDVLKLTGGAVLAQGMGLLAAPILARLYGPDAFGTFAVFTSLVATLGVVACLRYELAVMLPEEDDEAANLVAVSSLATLAVSGLSLALVLIGRGLILEWLKAPALEPYLWLVPLAVLAQGLFLALNSWHSRARRFGRLSAVRVGQAAATHAIQLAMGAVQQGAGLVLGKVLGSALASMALGRQTWRDDGRFLAESTSWQSLWAMLKRHRKFPLYAVWTALLNTVSWQLPVIMLSAFFSPDVVGFYALGNQLVRTPLNLVGNAIAQVFFQRSAEAKVQGRLAQVVEGAFRRLVSLGLFPMLLLTVIGRVLFVTLLGEKWAEAGEYTQVLSLYMFFNFIASPLTQLFSVLERQEVALVTNVALFFSRLASLWLGGRTGDVRLTLYLFGASGLLVYGGYSVWIVSSAGISLKGWIVPIVRWLGRSLVVLAVCWLIVWGLALGPWSLLTVYALGTIVYYSWVLVEDRELSRLLGQLGPWSWRKG